MGLHIARFKDSKTQRPVDVKADEVLIKFRAGTASAAKEQVFSLLKAAPAPRKMIALQKIRYHRVPVPAGVTLDDFLIQVRKAPSVEAAEVNPVLRSQTVSPDDPILDEQWGLKAIHAPEAWEVTQGDPSIVIAVVDSGIDSDHPDLVPNLVPGYNFISDTANADDDLGHGTQVAGIIAAKSNNGLGISGVAPGCKMMPLKVLDANGEGTAADVAEAIIYAADNGCRVINLSLGTYAWSEALKEAVEYALSSNCVAVASAGNNAGDTPCFPAAYPSVISVTAVDYSSKPCFFSNRGMFIDVAAPGFDVHTTEMGGGYKAVKGTSPAAAHVAGLAALLISSDHDISGGSVRAVVSATAADLSAAGWDSETGKGLVDCSAAIHERKTSEYDVGIARLDALPRAPLPNQRVNVRAMIRNHGPASSSPVALAARQDGHVVWQTNLPVLAAKEGIDLSFPWMPTNNLTNPASVLTLELAPCAGEILLADNQRTIVITTTSEPTHDVAIISAKAQGAPLEPGTPVPVTVEIVNLGNQDERDVIVRSFYWRQPLVDDKSVTLSAGERLLLCYEWMSPPYLQQTNAPEPLYRLSFDVPSLPEEQTLTNNTFILNLRYSKSESCLVPFHLREAGKEVHQWIAIQAYEFFTSQITGSELTDYYGYGSTSQWLENSANDHGDSNLIEGTYDEDNGLNWYEHFVQGGDGNELLRGLDGFWSGYIEQESAYERAAVTDNFWASAISAYSSSRSTAYYWLGRVAHVLADMTVPAHVHNDGHPAQLGDEEYYEQALAFEHPIYDKNFKLWGFGDEPRGGPTGTILVPINIEALFLYYRKLYRRLSEHRR